VNELRALATIGTLDESMSYSDRPTVKVIIKKGDTVLLLNNGLLPGGGVEESESDSDAVARELQEEIGVTVQDVQLIGTVIQYRNFLEKKYIINGYTAVLSSANEPTNPQDEGEANFSQVWLTVDEALEFIAKAIESAKVKPMDSDLNQGRLYNLMTGYELLRQLV